VSYPVYSEYGALVPASGFSYPVTWLVERLRFSILSNPVRSEVAHWKDDELVSFVPMEAVGEQGGIDASQEKPIGDVYTGYTYFSEQDILVAKITPCFENGKGAIAAGLKNGVGFGTTEFHVLRPLQHISTTWLFYLTMSDPFRKIGGSEMLGAGGQKRVQEDFIKNFKTGIPPLAEQQKIAIFLDWKTGQIDALIAKKKELMGKL
jgi:type I restriction enzyme, S subunit